MVEISIILVMPLIRMQKALSQVALWYCQARWEIIFLVTAFIKVIEMRWCSVNQHHLLRNGLHETCLSCLSYWGFLSTTSTKKWFLQTIYFMHLYFFFFLFSFEVYDIFSLSSVYIPKRSRLVGSALFFIKSCYVLCFFFSTCTFAYV